MTTNLALLANLIAEVERPRMDCDRSAERYAGLLKVVVEYEIGQSRESLVKAARALVEEAK